MMVRQTGHPLPAGQPASIRGAYQSFMIRTLHSLVDPVIDTIRDQPQPWSISSAYRTRHILSGSTAELLIENTNPNWKWKEYNTRGEPRKWPPYKKGTRLWGWAQRHGLPAYPIARNIKMWGTTGNYLFSTYYNAAKPRILAELHAANAAFVAGLVKGIVE